MKKLLFLFTFINSDFAVGQITFQKVFGETVAASMNFLLPADSGFILVGESGVNDFNYCMIEMDSVGNILWNKSFDAGIADHTVTKVIQTQDNGYIICGRAFFYDPNITPLPYIIKTSSNGDTLWTKFLENIYCSIGSIVQTTNGGYLIIGDITDSITFNSSLLLVRLDPLGNVVWSKSYNGNISESWVDILPVPSEDFIILGSNSPPSKPTLTKIDSSGSIIWNKSYTINGEDLNGFTFTEKNNEFLIAGSISQNGSDRDILIMKTDSIGNIIWSESFGGNDIDEALSVLSTQGNGILISGYSLSFVDPSGDAFLIKMDGTGNIIWSKTFGGIGDADLLNSIIETSDSGYLAVGQTNSLGTSGFSDAYIIRTDSLGNSGCNENNVILNAIGLTLQTSNPVLNTTVEIINSINTNTTIVNEGIAMTLCSTNLNNFESKNSCITLFPNPFHATSFFQILFSGSDIKDYELKIYNTFGKLIRTEKISDLNSFTFNRNDLNDGMYFYEILSSNHEHLGAGKFIVE